MSFGESHHPKSHPAHIAHSLNLTDMCQPNAPPGDKPPVKSFSMIVAFHLQSEHNVHNPHICVPFDSGPLDCHKSTLA